MRIVAVIPARMASTRFPGKPLEKILGLPMIEHVRRRVAMSEMVDEVYVATCDEEIKFAVEGHGGAVIMTEDTHVRCTDRVAEAARGIRADVFVNVQGDEPLILPEMIDAVTEPFRKQRETVCVNLVGKIEDIEEFENGNVVKAVVNQARDIIYMSREAIPWRKRDGLGRCVRLRQLGLVAFSNEFLQVFSQLEPTPLEEMESVDMLRAIEHGYRVRAVQVDAPMIGVDVPEDIERVEKLLCKDILAKTYLAQE